jgi:hypothetical protein
VSFVFVSSAFDERLVKQIVENDLLSAAGIRLETILPGMKCYLEGTVIRKVLAQGPLPIKVIVLVARTLNGEVAILLNKALCLLGEYLRGGFCQPLDIERECCVRSKKE